MLKNTLFSFLEFISRFIVINKFNKLEQKKINLGCGLTVASGWLNIDGSLNAFISVLPTFLIKIIYNFSGARNHFKQENYISILKNHLFMCLDLKKQLPFRSNSVNFIYSSHFLEHLEEEHCNNILSESFRILCHGGSIRIAVPDLEYAISLYKKNKKEMLNKYFFLNRKNNFSNHRFMYDFELLSEKLDEHGFTDIIKSRFKGSEFPESKLLDSYPNDSLFVEAAKK